MFERKIDPMFGRRHHAQALLWCFVVATIATIFPIRNATEYLNNKEASAYGSSDVKYVSLGDGFSCAVTTSGGVKCWGAGANGRIGNGLTADQRTPVSVSSVSSPNSISAGGAHSCASFGSGPYTYKCWGAGTSGQLGNNSWLDSKVPVSVL